MTINSTVFPSTGLNKLITSIKMIKKRKIIIINELIASFFVVAFVPCEFIANEKYSVNVRISTLSQHLIFRIFLCFYIPLSRNAMCLFA